MGKKNEMSSTCAYHPNKKNKNTGQRGTVHIEEGIVMRCENKQVHTSTGVSSSILFFHPCK